MVDMANNLGANIDLLYGMKHFKGSFMKACIEKISGLTNKIVPDTFETEYRTESFKQFNESMKPIKGIKEVIENLTIPFCVASSGPKDKIRLNLELTELMPYFENKIFSCYAINKWKPDPAVFLWAAETMGFKPNECLVIEDSLSGVKAAKAGGFDVFGFTAHDYNNELQPEATTTFNNMNKLLKML